MWGRGGGGGKRWQGVVFMVLCGGLVSRLGRLGVGLASVGSDVLVQLGWLTLDMMRQTLKRPLEHTAFLVTLVAAVMLSGWGLGIVIRAMIPGTGLLHLVSECTLWLLGTAMVASPLWNEEIRGRLAAAIPH